MIAAVGFAQKTVAVMGLGRTGLSAARALLLGDAKVVAWDDNGQNRDAAMAAGIVCQDLAKRDWADISALVLSPGIPHTHPKPHHVVELACAVNVPIIGDTELFAMAINARPPEERPLIIGITGTNGKSTTTALLTHILRECGRDAHAGGNIGMGCMDLPPPMRGMVYVLELSSYQLELTNSLRCNGAILLNISADHLERHGGFEGYMAAKCRIFSGQTQDDVAIVSMDDPHSQSICMAQRAAARAGVIPISANGTLSCGISFAAGNLYSASRDTTQKMASLGNAPALHGRHNGANAAAAFAAARHAGIAAESIAAAMQTFAGLEHRMEAVGAVHGVRFINDSKATNAQASLQALGSFDNIFWIAGGQAKAGGLAGLEPVFGHVRKAYLIGDAQREFAKQLKEKVPLSRCGNLEKAVLEAYVDARESEHKDPVVMLSPACASFDQFADFEARGDTFRRAVAALGEPQDNKPPA